MTKPPFRTIPLFLLFGMLFFIIPVFASNETYRELNLTDIPIQVADSLNVDTFTGQLICSSIFLLICVMPVTIIARSKNAPVIAEIGITLVTMGICVGIGWLPVWFLLIMAMIIALLFASNMRTWVGGGSS